jgi:hypothetical protein
MVKTASRRADELVRPADAQRSGVGGTRPSLRRLRRSHVPSGTSAGSVSGAPAGGGSPRAPDREPVPDLHTAKRDHRTLWATLSKSCWNVADDCVMVMPGGGPPPGGRVDVDGGEGVRNRAFLTNRQRAERRPLAEGRTWKRLDARRAEPWYGSISPLASRSTSRVIRARARWRGGSRCSTGCRSSINARAGSTRPSGRRAHPG